MKIHYKKLTQPYFNLVRLGIKTFELRKNDCDYQNGDILVLQEYSNEKRLEESPFGLYPEIEKGYTGREITTQIRCVLENYTGLEKGYVILGIEVLKK